MIGCTNKKTTNISKFSKSESVHINADTIDVSKDQNVIDNGAVSLRKDSIDWSKNPIDEDILKNNDEQLVRYIKYLEDTWKNAQNPLIVTYTGSFIGDYFHFQFEDASHNTYDFADGLNDLGEFSFFDDDYNGNPDFIGKKFKITWAWRLNKFQCCDGDYNIVEAKIPSITTIELVKN